MKQTRRASTLAECLRRGHPAIAVLTIGVTAWVLCSSAASAATVFRLACNPSADTLGWTIDAGRDFDGDGIADIAFSAPCARRSGKAHAGLVRVVSGKNGKILLKRRGHQEREYFGVGVAFIGDINGDGLSELAVGSPAFDAGGNVDAGKVSIFTHARKRRIRRIVGRQANGEFGFSIAAMGDLNGDGFADYTIGAPGEISDTNGKRSGRVHVISGRRGNHRLDILSGSKSAQRMGIHVANGGDINADNLDDLLVSSEKTLVGSILNAGYVQLLSGADLDLQLDAIGGAKNDRLGVSTSAAGDLDGDLVADTVLGAPGATVGGLKKAGLVILNRSGSDTILSDPLTQSGAAFGSAVSAVGDVDGDGFSDIAVGTPEYDIDSAGPTLLDGGSLLLFSGGSGLPLWRANGSKHRMRMGSASGGGIDFDGDGVPDVVSGNIGDAPGGRRGAGSVTIHSGVNGALLRRFDGTAGLSSRIYVASRSSSGTLLTGFTTDGRRLKKGSGILTGAAPGQLSAAIINDVASPVPGQMLLAVAGGHGGGSPKIEVYRLGVQGQKKILDVDGSFGGSYTKGVSVAAADLDGDDEDELIVVQADAASLPASGQVDLGILVRTPPDPLNPEGGYVPGSAFAPFVAGDTTAGGLPINAQGANIAVGNVSGNAEPEIVVAPVSGLPIVRVFTAAGVLLAEWLAYDPAQTDGVNLAIGDIDGDGGREIITGMRSANPLVKAFEGTGVPFVPAGQTDAVSFLAFATGVPGVSVATADIDYDGAQEILTVPGPPSSAPQVVAFETDGSASSEFAPFVVSGNGTTGLSMATTDRFVNK